MTTATLGRLGVLVAALGAAPLALAQEAATQAPHMAFVGMLAGFGMMFVLAIVAVVLHFEQRKRRERLALVEKLVTAGHSVPPELMMDGPLRLTLPEERRRDLRRGIGLLCWAIGIGLVFYLASGGQPRAAGWGLLLLLPALGNFVKAWLTAREIARGSADTSR
jgi:hypothetical protein